VRVDERERRSCSRALLGATADGAARVGHRVATTGVLTVHLRGRGDWDLAVFSGRRLLGASSAFGGRERVDVLVPAGRRVVAQACRRSGRGPTARVRFSSAALPGQSTERVQMLRVSLVRPGDLELLEALGLDVTHSVSANWADVVVYGADERAVLARAGFPFVVRIADMKAADRLSRLADARARASAALPSGRTTYRTLAEYSEDLKKIAETHPAIARRVEIGRSLEDRSIEGVELASGVNRTDDGRPTFVVMGLHHAREWPSGEMPMEFAVDLANGHGTDPRITSLLDRVRVIVLPVVNPDGFNVSRTAGPTPSDDDPNSTLPLALSDGLSYKRKNCRAASESAQSSPCISRPAGQGVDLNRNYGAYWGGVGSSTNPAVQNYRGTAPYSEPETEAVHRLSQTRNIVTLISHHTFTDQGVWLRQPGFCMWGAPGCSGSEDIVPDEAGMKELGDAMAAASGWTSELGWAIGEITGATEDWNYFATGTFGYTPEQRGPNFHPSFENAVGAEYTGEGAAGAAGGVRESLLRAGEQSADRRWHSVLTGTARSGYTLRLRKAFDTPTSQAGLVVKDVVDLTLTVPATGRYAWDVNPSTRPLSTTPEAYTLTCEDPAGVVLETRDVVVARGESVTADLVCGGDGRGGSGPGTGTGPGGGSAVLPRPTTARLSAGRVSARKVNRRKRFRIRVSVADGEILKPVIRLRRGKRTLYAARPTSIKGTVRITIRRRSGKLSPGRYPITLTARDTKGRRVTARAMLRVRR
jgi:murein tripeptide amidase MpaA